MNGNLSALRDYSRNFLKVTLFLSFFIICSFLRPLNGPSGKKHPHQEGVFLSKLNHMAIISPFHPMQALRFASVV